MLSRASSFQHKLLGPSSPRRTSQICTCRQFGLSNKLGTQTVRANAADGPENNPTTSRVTLKRPLGITFAEDDLKRVIVEDIASGGSAESSGKVWRGDVLLRSGWKGML